MKCSNKWYGTGINWRVSQAFACSVAMTASCPYQGHMTLFGRLMAIRIQHAVLHLLFGPVADSPRSSVRLNDCLMMMSNRGISIGEKAGKEAQGQSASYLNGDG